MTLPSRCRFRLTSFRDDASSSSNARLICRSPISFCYTHTPISATQDKASTAEVVALAIHPLRRKGGKELQLYS
ncbi:hypothetical protein L6452_25012 [Arctium lappa]|uniref:Uncharacterized protein n=1 Tax=Arctium lappa TaxID=4217 RepID=A0ACB9AA99_ARCLA|nr:hypothetical protein L6452_25012 [Arctium lappa]